MEQITPVTTVSSHQHKPNFSSLYNVATKLEASFLSEMLKTSDLTRTKHEFSGGAGEQHFTSFLIDEHARALSEKGGIGLAEMILYSLSARQK